MYEPAFLDRETDVDFILQGEYEYVLLDLVSELEAGGEVSALRGLAFRDETGGGRVNPRAEVIRDLDSLPWPARRHLPMLAYYDQPGGIPEPTLQIWASRGCPFRCIFCAWPQIMYDGNLYRTRNPVDVVNEIEAAISDGQRLNASALAAELNRRQIKAPRGGEWRYGPASQLLKRVREVGKTADGGKGE